MEHSSDNPRVVAFRVLSSWTPGGVYAEDLVDRAAQRAGLSGPNRGLVFALVMAVLRHETLLDYWIGYLRDGKLDDGARVWLRIGLAQLFVMGMAPHAAVNETVEQAGRARGGWVEGDAGEGTGACEAFAAGVSGGEVGAAVGSGGAGEARRVEQRAGSGFCEGDWIACEG